MRIISGKYRGLTLAAFKGADIRPTSDRAKESLFNILGAKVVGARVLDLFCGSGSLGIECLSRGAKEAHFNDNSKESLEVLKKNLLKLKGGENYKVTCADYADCLSGLSGKFDIIFLDPPYRLSAGEDAAKLIAKRRLLSDGGVAIIERDVPLEGEVEGLEKFDERRYGIAYLTFLRNKQ